MSFEGAQYKFLYFSSASLTDDTAWYVPIPQNCTIKAAKVVSHAGIAASDTNYLIAKITNLGDDGTGTDVIAEIDTRAAHENALAADVPENLNLTAAKSKVTAGDVLQVLFDENGTLTADVGLTVAYVLR